MPFDKIGLTPFYYETFIKHKLNLKLCCQITIIIFVKKNAENIKLIFKDMMRFNAALFLLVMFESLYFASQTHAICYYLISGVCFIGALMEMVGYRNIRHWGKC